MNRIDVNTLIGKTFNDLYVIEKAEGRGRAAYVLCRCKCGNTRIVQANLVKRNIVISCHECGKKRVRKVSIGDVVNRWTIIGYAGKSRWVVKCVCGAETTKTVTEMTGGTKKKPIMSCVACYKKARVKTDIDVWTSIKWNAKGKDREVSVTWEECKELLEKQNYKCALTGVDIYLGHSRDDIRAKRTASLDRIDSNKGYVKDNLQWVYRDINFLKSDFTMEEFIHYCTLVSDYFRNKDSILPEYII